MREDKNTLYKITTNTSLSDSKTDGYTEHGGLYNDKDVINISIRGDLSTRKGIIQISHELKHAFQFYNGDIIFAKDNVSGTILMNNSRPLEEEAYQRSRAYGGMPMDPSNDYIQKLSPKRMSLEQMRDKYPNHSLIYR